MSVDAIVKVKEAEARAKSMIESANKESDEIIENAKLQASETAQKIIGDALNQKEEILSKGAEKGKLSADPIIKKSENEAQNILDMTDEDLSEIVNLVVERIVIDNGNS